MIGALVLSKEARVMLLAEPELTRATAARGSGVDVDVEVVQPLWSEVRAGKVGS